MGLYSYAGIDSKGRKIKELTDASSVDEVVAKLRVENVTILDISEVKKDTRSRRIKSDDLLIFSRQLGSLISAGIPLVKSLGILVEQVEKKNFQNIIIAVQESIKSGDSLADSFSKYPKVFTPLFVNMVNVGEFSGNLDVMLSRFTAYLESYSELIRKVRSAMVYPIGIVIVAVLVLVVIFTLVIPGFEKIFQDMNVALPLPTQILIGASRLVKSYLWYIFGLASIAVFILGRFIRTSRGAQAMENLRSKIPVIGGVYRKMILARFTKTLSILVRSGVPILKSLLIAGKTSGSMKLAVHIEVIKDKVSRGTKVADALRESNLFPTMVTSMVGVGEEGGDLPGMLEKVSLLYESEVDAAVAGLISLLEPAIIVFLGVVIGGIVISLFLPILKIPQIVSQ